MASKISSSGFLQGPHGNLFFEREGNSSGQSILFVHGLGGTTNAYQMLVSELQAFDLVRFEWSGHGRSATPQTTSIESYVEDCRAVIDHLKLQSLLVVGHSLGGLIALHLAAKYPQIVKALMLLGPVRPPPEAGQVALAARAKTIRQEGMAAVADTIISNAFAAESFDTRKAQVALAREMLTRQSPEGYALAVEALKSSTLPEWKNIKARATVVSGEEDKVSTVAVGQSVVSEIGEAAGHISLAGVGHWHMLEAPLECVQSIKKLAA